MDIKNALSLYHESGASFDTDFHGRWLRENWWVSLPISAVYLVLVFGGQRWMENRPAYDLRRPLMMWSAAFALFSFFGLVNTAPSLLHSLLFEKNGWHDVICKASFYNGRIGMWAWLFPMSKVVELGDTFFIVLRKRKLIFIHWYHHIFTLIYSWYSHRDYISTGRFFATLNFGVHAAMYAYYALSAAKVTKIPQKLKVGITLIQLSQFFISIAVTVHTIIQLVNGNECDTHGTNIAWSVVLYLSFLYFFMKFFYEAYVKPIGAKKRKE
nr:elongation of very long chain fatty acids protein 6-like G protein [Hemicentrotus pulcherrimus]